MRWFVGGVRDPAAAPAWTPDSRSDRWFVGRGSGLVVGVGTGVGVKWVAVVDRGWSGRGLAVSLARMFSVRVCCR
ncbi:hypothetical protein CGE01nite_15910 [Cellulomonas gelida]|uniref:Uncharacterized protein n=1 Tax=Cellulomonas gelida TaxID=1712 RepID=A0A4Y3KN04_9CELL|nr:hypothetical protein CGE01nite_15910 [Cellulomonas gelida]